MTTSFSISYALLWALVLFLGMVVLGLARTVYQLQRTRPEADERTEEEFEDAEAPVFSAVDVLGRPFDSTAFDDVLAAVLFVSPDCPTCTATLNQVEALKTKTNGHVVVVCRSGEEACSRLVDGYRLTVPVIADEELEISKRFGSPVVPAAVLIENGRIRSIGHPIGHDELETMVEAAQSPQAGEPALTLAGGNNAGH
jgi:peroxiredoxin